MHSFIFFIFAIFFSFNIYANNCFIEADFDISNYIASLGYEDVISYPIKTLAPQESFNNYTNDNDFDVYIHYASGSELEPSGNIRSEDFYFIIESPTCEIIAVL